MDYGIVTAIAKRVIRSDDRTGKKTIIVEAETRHGLNHSLFLTWYYRSHDGDIYINRRDVWINTDI